MNSRSRIQNVLLVEDNPGDVFLVKEAWQQAGLGGHIRVVTNGQDAIDCLHQRNGFAAEPLFDLMILDLNLPIRNGREVLADLQQNPQLPRLPVAVLTTSSTDWDVCITYNIDPCLYFVKPVQFDELVAIVSRIADLAVDHEAGR